VISSDFGLKAKPGAPVLSPRGSLPFGEVEQRLLPPLLGGWGVVERKVKRGRALGRLVPQEGMELVGYDRSCLARLGNNGGMRTTEMT
jgi:hypothetical protein